MEGGVQSIVFSSSFSSADLQDKLSKKDKEVSSLVSQTDTLRAQVSGKSHWAGVGQYGTLLVEPQHFRESASERLCSVKIAFPHNRIFLTCRKQANGLERKGRLG